MKSIRFIIIMAVLLVSTVTARAALDFKSVPVFSPGKTESLTAGATLPSGTAALQFTVTLPDGFTLAGASLKLESVCSAGHIYRLNKVSETSYKCVIYSNSNTPFVSDSGDIFTLSLTADSETAKGDYTLSFNEIRCSDSSGNETEMPDAAVGLKVIIPAKSVTVAPSPANIQVGETLKLTATVTPSDASQEVKWSSSDPTKVTVSADGTVTGIAPGSATVTATTVDGTELSARCSVTVSAVLVSSIAISRTSLVLHPGESETLVATVLPANAGNRAVEWSSSDASVVTVSQDGLVEARAIGTAVVSVRATDGSGVTANCAVSVTVQLAESIALDRDRLELKDGETAVLKASVLPAEASQIVKWSSSDPTKVTVSDDGAVTAVSPGSATVTATTIDGTDLSASCSVTVSAVLVTSISISSESITLHKGEAAALKATVLPENASNRTVRWSTSKASVVTVSQDGRVEAVGVGTAVVSATSTDGSGITSICTVTVSGPLAESIALDRDRLEMKEGETATLRASITPSDASQEVEWSSMNPAVASVDVNGNVSALKAGTTMIIAKTKDDSGLTASCEVVVEEESGIDGVETCGRPEITVCGSEIVVKGIPDDRIIRVVDISGSTVYCGTEHRIGGLATGLYIVIVEASAYKVTVR